MNRRLVTLLSFALFSSAHAILPGTLTAAWPWAGKLGGSAFNATAVAVQDHWVLTAAHTVAGYTQDGARFQLDGGPVLASDAIIYHPTDDLALINVSESMPGWYDIYWPAHTPGQIGTMVGYGVSGTWNGSAWVYGAYPATYGTKREGRNRITGFQYIDFGDLRGFFYFYDFDSAAIDFAGDGTATTNEGTLGGGDSGGPTFLQEGAIWKVAAIHSWVGSFTGGPNPPQYGSAFGDVRLASYRTWIESIVPAEVAPTTMTTGPGSVVSGVVANLARPDDVRVTFRPGAILVATQDPLQIVLEGTSPVATTTQMAFCLESNSTITTLSQKVDLYNFSTSSYENVDVTTLGTSDGLVEVTNTSNPSNFIGPGNLVRARIRCKALGAVLVFPWQLRIDRAVWNIKR